MQNSNGFQYFVAGNPCNHHKKSQRNCKEIISEKHGEKNHKKIVSVNYIETIWKS